MWYQWRVSIPLPSAYSSPAGDYLVLSTNCWHRVHPNAAPRLWYSHQSSQSQPVFHVVSDCRRVHAGESNHTKLYYKYTAQNSLRCQLIQTLCCFYNLIAKIQYSTVHQHDAPHQTRPISSNLVRTETVVTSSLVYTEMDLLCCQFLTNVVDGANKFRFLWFKFWLQLI